MEMGNSVNRRELKVSSTAIGKCGSSKIWEGCERALGRNLACCVSLEWKCRGPLTENLGLLALGA